VEILLCRTELLNPRKLLESHIPEEFLKLNENFMKFCTLKEPFSTPEVFSFAHDGGREEFRGMSLNCSESKLARAPDIKDIC